MCSESTHTVCVCVCVCGKSAHTVSLYPHLSASVMNNLKNSSVGVKEGGGQGPPPDMGGRKNRSVSLGGDSVCACRGVGEASPSQSAWVRVFDLTS